MEGDNKSSFDKLVAGLNSEDRMAMLNRINQSAAQQVQLGNSDNEEPKTLNLKLKLQEETIFYKFMLWLRALFAKSSVEQLYGDDMLNVIAKKINHNHPGTVNLKIKALDYVFYERLQTLKAAADFFKPYFSYVDENPGNFYVFLSSFVAPELSEKINSDADPFIYPFSKEISPDLRSELAKRMDELLKNMEPHTKVNMYAAITSTNWLREFSQLPYIHFLSQFTNIAGDVYSCPYRNAKDDYNSFASVFANITPVPNEVLEALFLFSQRKSLTSNAQEKDIEKAVKEFITKANGFFLSIQSFVQNVPIYRLGRVVNENYDWVPDNMEGCEGWFPLFRNQWHKILDVRWTEWLREQKKIHLSENLKNDFDLDVFPVMAYRPWTKMWNEISFSCELTGGFLSWFVTERYDSIVEPLNTVAMEGIFYRSENRTEFNEGLSIFTSACNQMLELLHKLSSEGEYGKTFDDFSVNKIHNLSTQKQIETMMADTENTIKEVIKCFGKGARELERVFHGFFDESKDGIHESLQNLTTLKGHDNRQFREELIDIRDLLRKSLFYISELEPIDSVTE